MWRSLRLQPGALELQGATPLAWYASKAWLLRRITELVAAVDVQDSASIAEALSDCGLPGSLSLQDPLWLLQPGVLRGVTLQHGEVLPAAVMAVLPRFPHLTSLTLHCKHLPTNTPSVVSLLRQLHELCWRGSSVSYLLVESIRQLQHLTSLELSSAFPLPPALWLTQLSQLRHLELRSGPYGGGLMPPTPKAFAGGRGLSSFRFSSKLAPMQASTEQWPLGNFGPALCRCAAGPPRHVNASCALMAWSCACWLLLQIAGTTMRLCKFLPGAPGSLHKRQLTLVHVRRLPALESLLQALLPADADSVCLRISYCSLRVEALLNCPSLAAVSGLELAYCRSRTRGRRSGADAALATLLEQTTRLTELSMCYTGLSGPLPACLVDQRGLKKLLLLGVRYGGASLPELPPGAYLSGVCTGRPSGLYDCNHLPPTAQLPAAPPTPPLAHLPTCPPAHPHLLQALRSCTCQTRIWPACRLPWQLPLPSTAST